MSKQSSKYITIPHLNSNGARRRRENLVLNKVTGNVEFRDVTTIQIFKVGALHEHGKPLPRMISKAELRAARSIYTPHIGAKQLAKLGK